MSNNTKQPKIFSTLWPELGFTKAFPGVWRFVDMESGSHVGPQYKSREMLVADMRRYALDNWGLS